MPADPVATVSRETPGWRIENLRAGYGHRAVLDIPRLDLPVRGVTVILGPNGSGKSTLLRCMAGILRPTRGRILLDREDRAAMRAGDAAHRIAFVPQETPIPFAFTVEELVRLGAEAGAVSPQSLPVAERVESALQRWEVAALRHKSLTALSGGERQRAALARAWAQNCPYLLLDEPTSHLDLRHQAILRDALRDFAEDQKGRMAVVVLHDLNLAASLADHLVLLRQGQVVAEGAPDAVLTEATLRAVYQTDIHRHRDARTGREWIAS